MKAEEEYILSEYQDLGELEGRKTVHLVRNRIDGSICVQKSVSLQLAHVYAYLRDHPTRHIPKIQACIEDAGHLIILEEYITGRTLEDRIREGLFGEEEAVRILRQLCEALKPLHHADPVIICRDLKPENIMIDQEGTVKIVDFNVARTYQDGIDRDTELLGTREYAAPEQYGYGQSDNRTDLFALGVILNRMVSGEYPTRQRVTQGKLGDVVRKCIQMDADNRYQSAEELEEALRALFPQIWQENGSPRGTGRGAEDGSSADGSKVFLYSSESSADGSKAFLYSRESSADGSELSADNRDPHRASEESMLPPGFRSRTPWKMAVGAAGYLFLTWFCFSMKLEMDGIPLTGARLILEQALIWISQIVFVGIVFDYRGCRRYLTLLNRKHLAARLLLYVLLDLFLVIMAAFLCAFAEFIIV